MVMDIVGFYLPPNSGERVSFKITLLLGYSVFLIIVSDTLPATAVGTPLIGTSVRHADPTAMAVLGLKQQELLLCSDPRPPERWPGRTRSGSRSAQALAGCSPC